MEGGARSVDKVAAQPFPPHPTSAPHPTHLEALVRVVAMVGDPAVVGDERGAAREGAAGLDVEVVVHEHVA